MILPSKYFDEFKVKHAFLHTQVAMVNKLAGNVISDLKTYQRSFMPSVIKLGFGL